MGRGMPSLELVANSFLVANWKGSRDGDGGTDARVVPVSQIQAALEQSASEAGFSRDNGGGNSPGEIFDIVCYFAAPIGAFFSHSLASHLRDLTCASSWPGVSRCPWCRRHSVVCVASPLAAATHTVLVLAL